MALPEETPVKRGLQFFDDEDPMKAALESLAKENRSLKELVVQLSTLLIQRITGKK